MYKIDRRGGAGGGSKNRILGNYQEMLTVFGFKKLARKTCINIKYCRKEESCARILPLLAKIQDSAH